MSDVAETVEIATLDKEMAEEKVRVTLRERTFPISQHTESCGNALGEQRRRKALETKTCLREKLDGGRERFAVYLNHMC